MTQRNFNSQMWAVQNLAFPPSHDKGFRSHGVHRRGMARQSRPRQAQLPQSKLEERHGLPRSVRGGAAWCGQNDLQQRVLRGPCSLGLRALYEKWRI